MANFDNNFKELFNTEEFEQLGQQILHLLAQHIKQNTQQTAPVLHYQSAPELAQQYHQALPTQPMLDAPALLNQLQQMVLHQSLHIHHPHNFGHQVATPLLIPALFDLVAAVTNQAMAIYETGPSATMIERQVIAWLCGLVDTQQWQQGDGVLTSGGAQANLTALLAARQAFSLRQGQDIWRDGVACLASSVILASQNCHYSIARTAAIMGLGTQAVIKIATDAMGRMRLDQLEQALMQYGNKVMAIVANAGCTPSGSIDDLQGVADLAQRYQVWLHVDGAHGASLLLSEQLRGRLNGIARADSIIWDGHKLAYLPAPVSAVLFKQAEHSYLAFAQQASYLFDEQNPDKAFDQSQRTLECTKRMMGLKWWVAFQLYGTQQLGALVEHVCQLAMQMAQAIQQRQQFELLMTPQTNIVVFRYRPFSDQAQLRKRLVHTGQFHLTQVEIAGQIWLRTTLMNPLTELSHMQALLDAIQQAALALANE